MKFFAVIASFLFVQAAIGEETGRISSKPNTSSETISPFKLVGGIKSTNNLGRNYEMADPGGRRFKTKNEYYLGATHSSGWGLQALAVTSGTEYAARTDSGGREQISGYGAGDPSLTIVHPPVYEDETITVSGQFRRYFPVTNRSVNRNQRQYAYYNYINYKIGGGWNIFNQLIPRYFHQDSYSLGDPDYYVEDMTVLSKKVNGWLKYGIGQWSQIEWHRGTSVGRSVEMIPFVTFLINSRFSMEPRLKLPVYKVNSVYDTSNSVALGGAQAELYVQATL